MGGIDQGGAVVGDVEVGIAGGFADDGEAGFSFSRFRHV